MRKLFMAIIILSFSSITHGERCTVRNAYGNTYDVECDGNRRGLSSLQGALPQSMDMMNNYANSPPILDRIRENRRKSDAAQMSREQHEMQMKLLEIELQKKQLEIERLRQQSSKTSSGYTPNTASFNSNSPMVNGADRNVEGPFPDTKHPDRFKFVLNKHYDYDKGTAILAVQPLIKQFAVSKGYEQYKVIGSYIKQKPFGRVYLVQYSKPKDKYPAGK